MCSHINRYIVILRCCIDCNCDCKSPNVNQRNLWADYPLAKQIDCTDQQCNHGCLTNGTCRISKEHATQVYHAGKLQCCKWCCSCHTVIYEVCHITRERQQQEASSSKCRVHKVLSKSTKKLLYNDDCKCRTSNRHPDWKVWWQVQSKQQAGYHGREISNRYLLTHALLIQCLKSDTASDADCDQQCRIPAKYVQTECRCRN